MHAGPSRARTHMLGARSKCVRLLRQRNVRIHLLAHVSHGRPGQLRMRIHTNNNLLLVDTVTDVIILRATLNGHLSHVPTIFFVQRLHRTRLALTQNDNVKLSAVPACLPACLCADGTSVCRYVGGVRACICIGVIVGWLFELLLSHARYCFSSTMSQCHTLY